MAKPPPSGPEGDSGPDSNNQSDARSSVPKKAGEMPDDTEKSDD